MTVIYFNRKQELFYEDTVKTLLYFHEEELLEQFSGIPNDKLDIHDYLVKLYLSDDMKDIFTEFIVNVENITKDGTNEWLNDYLTILLKNSMDYVFKLLKSKIVTSYEYDLFILSHLDRYLSKTGYLLNESDTLNYFKQFNVAEKLFRSTNIDSDIESLFIKIYTNNEKVAQYDISKEYNNNELDIVRYVYNLNLHESIYNMNNLLYIGNYSKDFLMRVFDKGKRLILNDDYLLKYINSFNTWLNITKHLDGTEYMIENKYNNIVSIIFNSVLQDTIVNDEKETFKQLNDFILKYAIDNDIAYEDIDSLIEFSYQRGIFDTWNLAYYNQFETIDTEKTLNILNTFNKCTSTCMNEEILKLQGLSKEDVERIERLNKLLELHNENHSIKFDYIHNNLIHLITFRTSEGTIIEVSPKYLKIKKINKSPKFIYSCKNNQSPVSNYMRNVIPSKLPFEDTFYKMNYYLHKYIINAFDLRRKIE